MRRIKQYTRAEIREITLKRWKERHKMTICNKCKYLWKRVDKPYCACNENVAYSKNKKECKCFKEGTNVRFWRAKNNKYR